LDKKGQVFLISLSSDKDMSERNNICSLVVAEALFFILIFVAQKFDSLHPSTCECGYSHIPVATVATTLVKLTL
jgi:hypothetical protein